MYAISTFKEKIPAEKPKTKEQIHARLTEINDLKLALSDSIDRAPSEFQESTSGDDDATESEGVLQKLGEISRKREGLELEEAALRKQLEKLDTAA